ncbi:DUF3500 domain-containing protein [Nocardioides acrostichi]|uniref:DUF3500 domain-containing protein n=1 Tax=Nocardioides acrostichi TaxID=2784339 RepID=A0A930V424_9ACTN|nr:DUF3500 domain-containing protein [Nocardioides acrostichi]MBF4163335.1 DUF3500 domain-containing protein [Nocardioides acrostichi]
MSIPTPSSDDTPARDHSGHRIHAPHSALQMQRRTFMTRLFAATGVVAFGSMLAACDDSSSSSSASASSEGPGGTPPSGGPGGGGPGGMSEGITEEFKGLTTDGTVIEDLYAIQRTGVSTDGVVDAANAWLAGLTTAQRKEVTFDIDPDDYTEDEFRLWSNVDGYQRQGISLADMTDDQKSLAMGILEAGLSAKGLENADTIIKLNQYAGELIGNTDQFNEGLYWFTIMGTPSTTDPWGWQIDGHHLVINYFVLGDQVVMTPTFMGSEPVKANFDIDSDYEGLSLFDDEFAAAIDMVTSLSEDQQSVAIVSSDKTGDDIKAVAFADNAEVAYQGIVASKLDDDQLEKLWTLTGLFVNNVDDGHAKVTMAQVKEQADQTYFCWIGGTDADSVFYFRIQSPVIYIEFDCETPGPVGQGYGADQTVSRQHVHAITRTPNGNDYGKALLALHLALDH